MKKHLLIIVAALTVLSHRATAAEKFPASWRKTMTNDPATNPYLTEYSLDLQNPLQTGARNFIVARLVGSYCQGAKINRSKLLAYLASTGMGNAALSAQRDAYDAARMTFTHFDYRALAHLCAGAEYMLGAKGKLAQDIGEPGKGEPRDAYDPLNPMIMVARLVPRA
ncbi:hypothetical protein [Candidatus Phyllobacterium onerii]|uniref:hypothetical protein n=1 Tax=Candidatus Phyllobacterium onerii TaxID=3020828 RepID=UPI00232E8C22|nr:hypothetical protein [Phyllobacterium sp. IY22]